MKALEPQHEALLNQLEERFTTLRSRFDEIDREADRGIIQWRYAVDSAFELQAEFYRRFNAKPGTLVEEEPLQEFIYTAYGYDSQERVLCAAVFQSEELPRTYAYYDYGEASIDLAEFGIVWYTDRYDLRKVGRLVQAVDGTPLTYAEFFATDGQAQWMIEVYRHDQQGRMERVETLRRVRPRPLSEEAQQRIKSALEQQRATAQMFVSKEQADDAVWQFQELINQRVGEQADVWSEEIFEYEAEHLKRIVARFGEPPNEISHILYEAPREGETDEMLAEAAKTSLVRAVVDHLSALDAAQRRVRFYCLVLSYDAVADDGVLLTLGEESLRQARLPKTPDYLSGPYPPSLLRKHTNVEIWKLPDDYARFLREYRRENRWEEIRGLVNSAARALNETDWGGILKTTDDFIVYANDYEALQDTADEIRACVPEHKLQMLRDRGWLD